MVESCMGHWQCRPPCRSRSTACLKDEHSPRGTKSFLFEKDAYHNRMDQEWRDHNVIPVSWHCSYKSHLLRNHRASVLL